MNIVREGPPRKYEWAYHFNCNHCRSRLMEWPSRLEFVGKQSAYECPINFTCPICGKRNEGVEAIQYFVSNCGLQRYLDAPYVEPGTRRLDLLGQDPQNPGVGIIVVGLILAVMLVLGFATL